MERSGGEEWWRFRELFLLNVSDCEELKGLLKCFRSCSVNWRDWRAVPKRWVSNYYEQKIALLSSHNPLKRLRRRRPPRRGLLVINCCRKQRYFSKIHISAERGTATRRHTEHVKALKHVTLLGWLYIIHFRLTSSAITTVRKGSIEAPQSHNMCCTLN